MALPSIIRVGRVDSQYWTILMVLNLKIELKIENRTLGSCLISYSYIYCYDYGLGLAKYFLSSNSFKVSNLLWTTLWFSGFSRFLLLLTFVAALRKTNPSRIRHLPARFRINQLIKSRFPLD